MNSKKLLSLAAITAIVLLLLQPAAAATLRDVFGAFASMGQEKPEYDFDGSGGKITFGDVITALLGVFGLGGGTAACSKVADCPETTYGSTYCDGNNLVHDATEYACLNPGTPSSRCHASTKTLLQKACPSGCADGNCLATQCTAYETSCADFQDNDCDGKFDCDDNDCNSSDDCRIYATTKDARFPVKGGITTAYMEINGCIEIIEGITVTGVLPPLQPTTPTTTYLAPQADDNCINWPLDGDTIYLKNLSGRALDVYNASVSLGSSHFDDYTAGACAFGGHFSSERCPDSNSGDKGGFTESFAVTSINGVPGSAQECNINTPISAGQEIRVGVSDFSYCANRLPPECECSTDELLRAHKDNPITITLNTSIGKLNIYLYNFPI